MRTTPKLLAVSLLLAAASLGLAQSADDHGTPWSYEGKTGPLGWHKLDPAYRGCADGHEQSPIDIRGAHLNAQLPPIEFHYMAASAQIVNNGHTVQIAVKPGSYITVAGQRYDLVQFHFHHPAEEAVKGKLTDMDIHLVHKSAEGKLAVIAVRLKEDLNSANAVLATLWPHLPKTAGAQDKVTDMVNPGGFLPADRGYWTYQGSLTTPPCTEGVRWFVLAPVGEVSDAQLQKFRAAAHGDTSRPIQPLGARKVSRPK